MSLCGVRLNSSRGNGENRESRCIILAGAQLMSSDHMCEDNNHYASELVITSSMIVFGSDGELFRSLLQC